MRLASPVRLWRGYRTAISLVALGFMVTCMLLNFQQQDNTGDIFSDYELRFGDKGEDPKQQLDGGNLHALWKHNALVKIDRRPQAHFGGDNVKGWESNDDLRVEHDNGLEGKVFRNAGNSVITHTRRETNLTLPSMHNSEQQQNDHETYSDYDDIEKFSVDVKQSRNKENDESDEDEDDDDGDYEEEDFDDEYNEKLLENPNTHAHQNIKIGKTPSYPLLPTKNSIKNHEEEAFPFLGMGKTDQRHMELLNGKQHFENRNGPSIAWGKSGKSQSKMSSPLSKYNSLMISTKPPQVSQHLPKGGKHQLLNERHGNVQSLQNDKPGAWDSSPANGSVIQKELKQKIDTAKNQSDFQIVEDRIYWSTTVESMVPKGNTKTDIMKYLDVRKSEVLQVSTPSWNKCGRLPNQHVVFSNGMSACARYRDPHNKLVLGEVLSYYLAGLLGLDNVPIVVLSEVDSTVSQWQQQRKQIQQAHWKEGKIVAFIQWIDNLNGERSRVKMPYCLLNAFTSHRVVDRNSPFLQTLSTSGLIHLLQWGEMIIFDYITGNYDRVASMQDGADKESKPSIMHENIRNLRRIPKTNKFWLIDNESGLFDAYDLMYRGAKTDQRFQQFHEQTLKLLCIFRRRIVENIFDLLKNPNPEQTLLQYAINHEPLFKKLSSTLTVKDNYIFLSRFKERVEDVATWINYCKNRE
ncbi:uncharacterized protein LOC106171460 [Lingula anatina]|uniref:Uncharacterized protein LOC106171460 n=1 Tax=Lingula anatina TaxID=7574 RepID=A0A1S3JAC4_LINAN|nr:uncharacterized protein LOC106171460 [Lingula anatina]XP_013407272.1 uncharacterized protein LOC106171460 [Lingula anatina]XP_013407273.1 uncharacterized protein LOC106171460 [Lingula anatina]XP_013407274.1 uncharacterized protein LOC106171460 [Lingula anatina]XP_013407276.1 uncharacterized protein LOC106171460 [Lingula anatina]XP_013407277.1 uncharacterized protein LOC106171460 [Lingula anatina]|eukprot:XP_013407271.1 uncharacterized protein LOC106171460 [Lingula anatina]